MPQRVFGHQRQVAEFVPSGHCFVLNIKTD
jgi:hypothetical protein